MKKALLIAAMAILSLCTFTACEDDKKDNKADGGSIFFDGDKVKVSASPSNIAKKSIVGTWSLSSDGFTWYIHFNEDGTWKITNDKAGTQRRVYGTYSFDGESFKGNMTNPGTGTGEISGNISGDAISLDFCEFWHTPYKHVPYDGMRQ